ncbi:hypothetical protein SERLA73DRAFT_70304 [Serpula lacrymans var. lacrymans S7.3]|uniref:protein-tyrosine-phosphatase n=1 Tax=Serpula lacrymans var. lacrymans (strain S7.3) TaxID=936435 RepID=F8PMI6_SERL3|nr:hypothetical protein SERLA73DRAFT_70304 [Serpula lacrymans var. lacrymans S7.3]
MADDFFSAVPFNGAASDVEPIDSFAQAIANRFGSGDLLTARLVNDPHRSPPNTTTTTTTTATPALPLHLPNAPLANLSIAPHPSSLPSSPSFASISPANLTNYISDSSNLIVDIRPHAAHSSARVFRAVSLSVPSTLLKRPLFSLEKLCAMLPSRSSRSRFSHWQSAARIIVYDADSSNIPDNSNVCGLLKKFKNEGFAGDLAWIRGGFQAVWQERRDLITTDPPSPEEDDDDSSKSSIAPALRTKHLPKSAFSLSTTTSSSAKSSAPRPSHRPAANPFFDTIRQNVELSQGITEHNDADQADVEEGAETLAMQFYRIELAEQRRLLTVMEHHSRESGVSSQQQDAGFLPPSATFPFSITAGVEKGTKNRYTHIWPFEHARVRLHSRKFRRNIDEDDYVNASYVQPLGTCKRYIATQGPLPATFVDFWTLCWEQNVHVIVMLTREVENAMVKCGTYWTDTAYGPLRLRLVSSSPAQSPAADATEVTDTNRGFFFALREPTPLHSAFPASGTGGSASKPKGHTTIKRVFELTHTAYPDVLPRRVTHLQYLEWPDMNVPEDPRGVLALMKEVAVAVEASSPGPSPGSSPGGLANIGEETAVGLDSKSGIAKFALGKKSPVLLHCSAGVGRTGGFIAVDAVLDAIRGEVKKMRAGKLSSEAARRSEENMDVDEPEDASTVPSEQCLTEARSQILGTVPLQVSAGDGKKRRTRASGKDVEGKGLVVHVPFAGWGDSAKTPHGDAAKDGDEMNVDESPDQVDLDASGAGAGWGSNPSTREWAERVSDQTGLGGPFETHGSGSASGSSSDLSLPLGQGSAKPVPATIRSRRMSPPHASYQTVSRLGSLSLSPPRRTHSPPHYPLSLSQLPILPRVEKTGSPSSSSNPSALNSADDSVGSGSGGGSASGSGSGVVSASGSGSGLGSAAGSGSGLGSGSRAGSGLGSGSGKASASGRSASSIGIPPSSISASNSGSGGGSISASISGSGSTSGSGFNSGTGSGSMSGSGVTGLLRARMRDSSATSLSNISGSSGEARVHTKVPAQVPVVLREPSAIRISHDAPSGLSMKGYFSENVGMDVDGDKSPRSFSAPLGDSNEGQSGDIGLLAQTTHSVHYPHRIGASPVASLSTPMLAAPVVPGGVTFFLNREKAEMSAPMSRSASKSSSDSNLSSHPVSTPFSNVQTGSDKVSSLASPPPPSSAPLSQRSSVPPSRGSPLVVAPSGLESESVVDSGEPNPESSGQVSAQTASSSSSGDADKSGNGNNSGSGSGKAEVSNNTSSSTVKLPGEDSTGTSLSDPSKLSMKLKNEVIKEQTEPSIDATPQKEEAPTNEPSPPEGDRRAAGHSVIDYKLPRALHSDLSPPLLSSFDDPIWTVVLDMREQRMSLCQSLRQYVFVHAAVIEGALMVMDEERGLWGSGSEGSPGASVGGSEGRRSDVEDIPGRGAYFPAESSMEISAVGKSDSYQGRTHSVSGVFSGGMVSGASSVSGGGGGKKGPPASASSSSGLSSSPSKGKRVASPTELLKEDKAGEVSLAKRPSIKRKPGSSDGKLLTFDTGAELATGILSGASGVSRATPGSGGSVVKSTTMTGGPMAPERDSGPSGTAR